MQDLRQAMHAAGIRPLGLDPLQLSEADAMEALGALGTVTGNLARQQALVGEDLGDYLARVGAAMRAVAAFVEPT